MLQHDNQRHAPSLRRPAIRPVVAPVWERTLSSRRQRPEARDQTEPRPAANLPTQFESPAR